MLLTIKDVKKYQIKPALMEGKIIGIRVFDGYRKVFPGTLTFSDVEPEALDWIKEHIFKDQEMKYVRIKNV